MNENNKALDLANKLELLLRKHLKCHYTDFGVKANDNLLFDDWKRPINFALGYKYADSNNNQDIKEKIDNFLGNMLVGDNINDIIKGYQDYGFSTVDEAYSNIEKIIDELEDILQT